MSDAKSRLIHCFSVVFPDLEDQEIPTSNVASVGAWDSLAGINLYSLVEEEFGIEISMDDLVNLFSFEMILDFVEGGNGVS